MESWSILTLLFLTVILTHYPTLTKHQHPKPEFRCQIVNDGYCTVHEKADLCSMSNSITGRPKDEHQLLRLETVIKSTGSRPDQTGNVTVKFICKLRDGVKCFPSPEEELKFTEGVLLKYDPDFAKQQKEFLEEKTKTYKANATDYYNQEYQGRFYLRLVDKMEAAKYSKEQQDALNALPDGSEEKDNLTLIFQKANAVEIIRISL